MGNAGMIVPSHFTPLAAPGMIAYGPPTDTAVPRPVRPPALPRTAQVGRPLFPGLRRGACDAAKPLLAKLNLLSAKEYECLSNDLGDFGLTRKGLLMLCRTPRALEEENQIAKRGAGLGHGGSRLESGRDPEARPRDRSRRGRRRVLSQRRPPQHFRARTRPADPFAGTPASR